MEFNSTSINNLANCTMALRRKPSDGALFSSRDPGLGRATPHKRAAAGGGRGARRPRRCARLCCLGLVGYLVLAFLAGAVYVKPRLDSFGYETPYFIAAPAWWRWLTEPAPVVWTPAPGADAAAMRAIGAERVGEFWISRVASTPNVTIVHNFLSKEDCGFLRGLADAMGLVPANTFGVSNGAEEGGGGGLEKVWRWVTAAFAQCRSPSIKFVRTSKGKFVELAGLARGDLTRLVRILRRAEAVTGLAMGNFEAPFLQLYEPDDVFLAHYDLYATDMTKPFPYHDNMRSFTLLAYLADTLHGGETEFMLAQPGPILVRPREGAAVVWSNCVLEPEPRGSWEEPGRCRAGGGSHAAQAWSDEPFPGEAEQPPRPCCVKRDWHSVHQSRPVGAGGEKRTMTLWMRQRFTDNALADAGLLGYGGE